MSQQNLETIQALYAAFGFMWSAMQYVHHYGTERHVTRGARNLWIFAPVDALLLNHNWHRAHHEHPTVPWVHLPRIGCGLAGGKWEQVEPLVQQFLSARGVAVTVYDFGG